MEIVDIISVASELIVTAITVGEGIRKAAPRRECKIEITNSSDCYILTNPGMFICRGFCVYPMTPKIQPSGSGDAVFAKTPHTGRGFSGIITYDLLNSSSGKIKEQMSVFFKVPYNLNLKMNEYAVGVFDVCRGCNVNLHEEMAKKNDITFVRGAADGRSLIHISQDVTIRATMSDGYSSVLKVDLEN